MTLQIRDTLTREVRPIEPSRARPRPDVHLRPDRLPLRPRRQPPELPAGRPDPARAAVPRARGLPGQEHHRRRPPPRRPVRSRRGPDARAAGLEHKTSEEIAAAYEAAFHADEALVNILPPTSSRGRPSTSPRCSSSPSAWRTPATPIGRTTTTCTTRWRRSRLRPPVGQPPRRPPRRPPDRGARRARQARSGRLRVVEVGRRAARAQVAVALGRRVSRAGTSNARRWRCATSASGSTSTPAASTTSSRITRTRSPSRRRWSAGPPATVWVHGEHLLMSGSSRRPSRPPRSRPARGECRCRCRRAPRRTGARRRPDP